MQCFIQAFIIINQSLGGSLRVLSENRTHNSLLCEQSFRHVFAYILNVKSKRISFRPKMNRIKSKNCSFMLKTNRQIENSAYKRIFTGKFNQCKQTDNTSIVYITNNRKLRILFRTLRIFHKGKKGVLSS